MEIIQLPVKSITPYVRNPRHNAATVAGVAASISEFGFRQPIVVDKKNIIVAGHTRFLAAHQLGLESVPCVRADDLTPAQIKAYRILDNKLAEKATWDFDLLKLELEELADFDFEPFEVSFDDLDLTPEVSTEDDEIPPLRAEAITKLGDTWICGPHTIKCMSCLGVTLPVGLTFDLCVTDPPYGVSYVGKTKDALKIQNDDLDANELRKFWDEVLRRLDFWLKPGAAFYVTVPPGPPFFIFAQPMNDSGWVRQILTWVKDSLVLGYSDYQYRHEFVLYGWKPGGGHHPVKDRTQTSVFEIPRPKASVDHPTMKPLDLWMRFIENSTDKGANVVDPFLGSGTTLIACERLGRICYGMEIEPHYVDVCCRRFFNETGIAPIRESDGASFPVESPPIDAL